MPFEMARRFVTLQWFAIVLAALLLSPAGAIRPSQLVEDNAATHQTRGLSQRGWPRADLRGYDGRAFQGESRGDHELREDRGGAYADAWDEERRADRDFEPHMFQDGPRHTHFHDHSTHDDEVVAGRSFAGRSFVDRSFGDRTYDRRAYADVFDAGSRYNDAESRANWDGTDTYGGALADQALRDTTGTPDPAASMVTANVASYAKGPDGHHFIPSNPAFATIMGKPLDCGCGNGVLPDQVGPFLRLKKADPVTGVWSGTVLYVLRSEAVPQLVVSATQGGAAVDGIKSPLVAKLLYTLQGFRFWRFELDVPQAEGTTERTVTYGLAGKTQRAKFTVPGKEQGWRWGYFSCAGYVSGMTAEDKAAVPWDLVLKEALSRHASKPYHLMVGGGDQLYNDQVFDMPVFANWQTKSRAERESMAFTPEMAAQAQGYYFTHYMTHFSQVSFAAVVANIPQVWMWDDHDAFDGLGSYPTPMENSPVVKGTYKMSRLFYLLFQHHVAPDATGDTGLVRIGDSLSPFLQLGPRVALFVVDMRSERDKTKIMPAGTWTQIADRIRALPPTVKHVVLGSGVPLIYPSSDTAHKFMLKVSQLSRESDAVSSVAEALLSKVHQAKFGEPELLDDMEDHWSAEIHKDEKNAMLRALAAAAGTAGKPRRITFIAGDVHLACTARFRDTAARSLESDPKYMLQIVSSAVINEPPPDFLVIFLTSKSIKGPKTVYDTVEESLLPTFASRGFSPNVMLLNKRNYAHVEEGPGDSLSFTLVMELSTGKFTDFTTTAPALKL